MRHASPLRLILTPWHSALVLEEFGFPRDLGSLSAAAPTTRRDKYVGTVLNTVVTSQLAQGVLAGANVWAWAGSGRPAAGGIPATAAELCKGTPAAGGDPQPPLTGGQPSFGACFTDQGSRTWSCPADTWWATPAAWPQAAWPPGSSPHRFAFLGDPPHESQGWYSIYDSDSTVAVMAAASNRLAGLAACASAVVDGGAPACAANIPIGAVGNLC